MTGDVQDASPSVELFPVVIGRSRTSKHGKYAHCVLGVFAARLRIPSRRDWLRLTHVPTHALARVLVVTRVRSIAIPVLALPAR